MTYGNSINLSPNMIPSIADVFSSSTAYSAGDYVMYNGQLYIFTADHAAGAWTGSDATKAKLADDVSDLKSQIKNLDGLSPALKAALLQLAEKVAYIDDDGQDYYQDLCDALYPLTSITAVYTQSGTVYTTDSLDSLKSDLVVTAVYDGGSTETVSASDYTLSGNLTEGTSVITVSYGGKNTTFSVTVTTNAPIATSIAFVMTNNSSGSNWDSTTLTGSINGNGTNYYPGGALQNLIYKIPQVTNKTVRISFDYTYTGYSEGSGGIVGIGAYTSNNPTNNSTQRKASNEFPKITENGSSHYEYTFDLSALTWTSVDDYYLGVFLMNNANKGSNFTFSNFSVGVF